jgi:integrase
MSCGGRSPSDRPVGFNEGFARRAEPEMRSKPKGAKYRNLHVHQGSILYERVVRGRRYRVNTRTTDWAEAALFRDLYEEKRGVNEASQYTGRMPTFKEFSKRYLKEDTAHLAATTLNDRPSYLRPDGPLMKHFGHRRLDEITSGMLREWWGVEIIGAERTAATGRHYIDVLASILGYAKDLDLIKESPVPAFREQQRRRSRTKRGRAEATPGQKIRPIEDPKAIGRLIGAARAQGLPSLVFVLLQLDAGLRQGEALGLRWSSVRGGLDASDLSRHLHIDKNRPRGGDLEDPKSGRVRDVALSLRLRAALLDLYRQAFDPEPIMPDLETLVLPGIEPSNFRARDWLRILKRAKIAKVAMKDLRDTFASQLLTCGVPLGYISAQLGHADDRRHIQALRALVRRC